MFFFDLQAIYVLHPTVGLKTAIFALQLLVDGEVLTLSLPLPLLSVIFYSVIFSNISICISPRSQTWKKVVYVERLLQLFRYVPREQLTIPDFVFQ